MHGQKKLQLVQEASQKIRKKSFLPLAAVPITCSVTQRFYSAFGPLWTLHPALTLLLLLFALHSHDDLATRGMVAVLAQPDPIASKGDQAAVSE